MNQQAAAIIIAGALIAAAIALTNHWQVMLGQPEGMAPTALRLNRWTGLVNMCVLDPDTMRHPNSFAGAELSCKLK